MPQTVSDEETGLGSSVIHTSASWNKEKTLVVRYTCTVVKHQHKVRAQNHKLELSFPEIFERLTHDYCILAVIPWEGQVNESFLLGGGYRSD